MALQKLFYIFKDPENASTHLVYIDDFYKYFKDEADGTQCIRQSYLVRSLKNIKLIEGKEAVPLLDIFKYCFSHWESFKSCEKIVRIVENLVLYGNDNKLQTSEYVRSSFQLYNAKTCFPYVNKGLKHLQIDEANIVTLVTEHRNSFSDEEWKQIVLFEYHFSKENEEPVSVTCILSDTVFNKDAHTKTAEGKALISKYLAENIDETVSTKERESYSRQ